MSVAALAIATSTPSSDVPRRSANYHPSVWGDHFLKYASQPLEVDEKMEDRIGTLKETVRKMLVPATDKPLTKVRLIDSIQRLGVDYHFESEIDEVLCQIQNNYVKDGIITLNEDLHSMALLFRLLRQQGYHVSPDVFNKFKDEQGKISETIANDVEGMLSLYEAADLRIHGEDILDEALDFTSTHLKFLTTQLSDSHAGNVIRSLKRPLRRRLPRLEAWHYFFTYQEDPSHIETLLAFAKLDFNGLQKLHQRELGNLSKWWKDLDFATKLPFARNRLVEAYFWILGVYFEPCYSLARRIMTKVISLTSVIDDIYDVYGTLEELQLFTEAIDKWDISCMDFLPEYMKLIYQPLLDVYDEIERETAKEGRAFCVNYGKEQMRKVVRAYLAEAKWFHNNYTPTLEEYMEVALVSSAYRMLTTVSFIGVGSIATEEALKWVTKDPKIVKASLVICRLMDDIVSSKFEQERGHVVSALECYMKQHGTTEEETIVEFRRRVENAWKDINEACLQPFEVAKPLLMRSLNLSRVISLLYTDDDCYTHSAGNTKKNIEALLINPVA
uniref:Terpene synthase 4-1 n=1 Tax=Copaifera langsdorffii TaxID=280048 RepID=U3MMV6_COPLA|nr:terpene synthase 4-1 [Copaifera langsdorffii]